MVLLTVGAVAIIAAVIYFLASSSHKNTPANSTLPPGPPGLPLLGNLLSIPPKHSWLQFFQWSKQYGPLYRLNIAGREHYIVSSEKIANDLLRDRGNIYSSREQLPAAVNLLSDNLRPLFWPYGEDTRQGRKLMHQLCQPSSAVKYESTQVLESTRMLEDLIRKPQDYERWFMRYSAGLIFRIGFGRILEENDPLLDRIFHVVHNVERVASPGAYMVDTFPWMQYLPDAIAPFKRELKALHAEELDVFRTLLKNTRSAMAHGGAPDCWEKSYLENQDQYRLTEDKGAYVVGTLFEAGAGTTAAAMMSFLLAMVTHPEVFAKLQASIDAVVGPSRPPTFEDLPQLPYVRAVVKEVLRWRPVTAGGLPHMSTKDDTYAINGKEYFIPAGTNVHPNQWAIHRDPDLYPEGESFIPGRWLESTYPTYREPLTAFPNVQHYSSFGFGRRICPGMHIAERSLYLLSARIAWACNLSKAKDEKTGKDKVYEEYDYCEGFNVQPNWFPFELSVRSEERWKVVQEARREAEAGDPLRK